MKRDKFERRKIVLVGQMQKDAAMALVSRLPVDAAHPLQIEIGELVKPRKLDQNALMWAGPLKDIAEQGFLPDGRRLSAKGWHEIYKRLYLPEVYDPELCKSEDYQKWEFDAQGEPLLIGSTTDLTVKGMAQYIEQIHADGANMGVLFHANPNEQRWAA